MSKPPAAPVRLRAGDRERLQRVATFCDERFSISHRARVVLMSADGYGHRDIWDQQYIEYSTIAHWLARYEQEGMAGLETRRLTPGHARVHDRLQIVWRSLRPPRSGGRERWDGTSLGGELGISPKVVGQAWREYGLHPHGERSMRYYTRPELSGQVVDVLGLYVAPPRSAIVLRVVEDDDRTPRAAPQDSLVATVSAGLRDALQQAEARPREDRLLDFLDAVVEAHPDQDLRLVLQQWKTFIQPEVRDWIGRHPRVRVHVAPDQGRREVPRFGSWRHMTVAWVAQVERHRPRGGRVQEVRRFAQLLRDAVDGWRSATVSYAWVKPASPRPQD